MKLDNESWLIEIGDVVIEKKADSSYSNLSEIEKAIYCLWVIDYSVRNSGTLEAVDDLHPNALDELHEYANTHNWNSISTLLSKSENETAFCNEYYELFDSACNEIRSKYENN